MKPIAGVALITTELNPSHARAHASLGWWLLCRGRSEEAIASSRRGRDLDPLSLDLGVSLGVTYFMARRYDDAIGQLESILAIDPNDVGALLILGMALVETARFEEAIHALELGASRSDRNPMLLGMPRRGVRPWRPASRGAPYCGRARRNEEDALRDTGCVRVRVHGSR